MIQAKEGVPPLLQIFQYKSMHNAITKQNMNSMDTKKQNPIKVVIADDHQVLLDACKVMLNNEQDIVVVGTAINGQEVIHILEQQQVDVAVLDYKMPVMDGLETTIKIKQDFPEVKVLVLTMIKDGQYVVNLMEAGVSGYLLKESGAEMLVDAIRTLAKGKTCFGDDTQEALLEAMVKRAKEKKGQKAQAQLTKREKQILSLISRGKTSIEIGQELHIETSTVETHRRNLLEKTGSRNSLELVRYGVENGY